MQINGQTIAVCSWSLQPTSMTELVEKLKTLGLSHVQLQLRKLAMMEPGEQKAELAVLSAAGIGFTGGMLDFPGEDYSSIDRIRQTGGFIPDAEWPDRKVITARVAKLAKQLGMNHVMAHVGFVPPHGDPKYPAALARVREVAKMLAGEGLALHMETGQEPAGELLKFMQDLNEPNVHINFDPANMILYGAGDPIAAIGVLGKHIKHVHVKDATASAKPGVDWGEEVPFGKGQVGPARFIAALKQVGYTGPLAIEREAGNDRVGDIQFAIQTLSK